jgi:hypothetical protein
LIVHCAYSFFEGLGSLFKKQYFREKTCFIVRYAQNGLLAFNYAFFGSFWLKNYLSGCSSIIYDNMLKYDLAFF